MRVLIACEFSGTVRDAFIARGHDAVSCDLLPTEAPGPHIVGDVLEILNDGFDLMIAFPPCTHLAASGARYWPEKQSDGRQGDAIQFARTLYDSCIPKVSIENPVGVLSTVWRRPDQIVQPYYFGDAFQKTTCLWLKNLEPLSYDENSTVAPLAAWGSNSYRGGPRKDGTRTRSKLPCLHRDPRKRSLSFKGMAGAMAEQWG